jgi:quercetin dioxygenase-like cupin family protein
MSHPESDGPPDRRPIEIGEIWENPVTRERATILERPWDNPAGRATAELTALVGARVMGEHRHPALVERFTVLEGELTVKRNGQTSVCRRGEAAVIEPGVWHDWWNAGDRDARVRVEITPGERFVHMIETFFGLARLGHTDGKGMPNPLQLALSAREFSDVVVFRSPPLVLQRAIFGSLAPIARWRALSRDVPAALTHRAGTSDNTGANLNDSSLKPSARCGLWPVARGLLRSRRASSAQR